MICDSCIHKEVCYELEEDRQALKHCSDYFNFEEELEKIKAEIKGEMNNPVELAKNRALYWVLEIIDKHISELKGE